MNKDLILLFDSLRDPRDLAQVIHLAFAFDIKVILTGNSIPLNNFKVLRILSSWIKTDEKKVSKFVTQKSSFEKEIISLKKKNYKIIGTICSGGKDFTKYSFPKEKIVIVFGTETSGLSKEKQTLMDELITIPMKNNTRFFTLSSIAPLIAFEKLKQKK